VVPQPDPSPSLTHRLTSVRLERIWPASARAGRRLAIDERPDHSARSSRPRHGWPRLSSCLEHLVRRPDWPGPSWAGYQFERQLSKPSRRVGGSDARNSHQARVRSSQQPAVDSQPRRPRQARAARCGGIGWSSPRPGVCSNQLRDAPACGRPRPPQPVGEGVPGASQGKLDLQAWASGMPRAGQPLRFSFQAPRPPGSRAQVATSWRSTRSAQTLQQGPSCQGAYGPCSMRCTRSRLPPRAAVELEGSGIAAATASRQGNGASFVATQRPASLAVPAGWPRKPAEQDLTAAALEAAPFHRRSAVSRRSVEAQVHGPLKMWLARARVSVPFRVRTPKRIWCLQAPGADPIGGRLAIGPKEPARESRSPSRRTVAKGRRHVSSSFCDRR